MGVEANCGLTMPVVMASFSDVAPQVSVFDNEDGLMGNSDCEARKCRMYRISA